MGVLSKWFPDKNQGEKLEGNESIEVKVFGSMESVIDYCDEGQKLLEAGNCTMAMEYFQAAIETNKYNGRLILD